MAPPPTASAAAIAIIAAMLLLAVLYALDPVRRQRGVFARAHVPPNASLPANARSAEWRDR